MSLAKDEDGWSLHKVGFILSWIVITLKMVGVLPESSPDDALLWLVFMGTVGSYAGLLEVAKRKWK